ncbi:MAG: hypothetical protein RLZ75_2800 [Pseudomonadota bacterium]
MQDSESPLSILQETEQAYAQASQGVLSIIDLFNVTQRLTEADHSDIAIQLYRLWLERTDSPISYAVQFNLAVLLSNFNDNEGAEATYRAAIAKKPTFVEGHLNLGTLLERKGDPEAALTVWRAVLGFVNLEFPADCAFYVQALNNLGRLLEIQKQLPEAEAMLALSLKQDSMQTPTITHWVHIRQKLCKWPIYSDAIGIAKKDMLAGTSALAMLSASDDPTLQLTTAKRYVNEKVLKDVSYLSSKQSYGHDRLRIAYLSSDFCSHAVSILTAELYGLHDRSKFEVFGFCWSHEDGSPLRARVISGMDHHIKIGALSDEAAAQLIRSHEIDILIDLHGLTLGTRHDILSYRPAPLQITWLGFPGSTALPEIDYVLCDAFVFPPELEPFFTEKPLRMPHTFQVNDRQRSISASPTRESCDLPEQAFVFCSFNNSYKITPELFKIWMRILKRVPDSILWLVADNETVRNNLYKQAKSQGVASNRLYFADRALPSDYLARFQIADLFLDTFPFGGGTTASDALWAGLPLLTYSGKTFASRMAGSLLKAVDLAELITFNLKDYEEKAVKLAQHPEQIAAMKQKLVDNRLSCALFDTPRFVRDLENTFMLIAMKKDKIIKQTPINNVHNADVLNFMRDNYNSVVEVGSSSGALAKAYLNINSKCKYIGIEIDEDYAEASKQFCTEVLSGNVENLSDQDFQKLSDAQCWVFADALEHLYNPWRLIERIKNNASSGVDIIACIPNAQYWGLQSVLNSGRFIYEDSGLLDRTHIRWLTRITILDLFNSNGFQVVEMTARILQKPSEDMLKGIRQIALASGTDPDIAEQDAIPFQYVVRAVAI